MNTVSKHTFILSGVLIALLAFGSGCSSSRTDATTRADNETITALREEIATLKTHNNELQEQLASYTTDSTGTDTESTSLHIKAHFTDVDDAIPGGKKYILQLAELGIFDTSNDTFKPYETITRGEYVALLYQSYNAMRPDSEHIRLAPGFKNPFADLPEDHPSYPYVMAFANAGYSVGYPDGTFRPDKPLTREEMFGIKVPVDFGREPPPAGSNFYGFNDWNQVSGLFSDSISQDWRHAKEDYLKGNLGRAYGKIRSFHPKKEVLRYEAAATLWQTDYLGEKTAYHALNPQETNSQ